MSLDDWKAAKQRLEGLYPNSEQRGRVTSSLRDLSLEERLEYFEGDDDYVRAGLLKFTGTIQARTSDAAQYHPALTVNLDESTIQRLANLMTSPPTIAALTHAFRQANLTRISANVSGVSTTRMTAILDRLQIAIGRQLVLPCCLEPATQDFLPAIDIYQWEHNEEDSREIGKCAAWLEKHLAVDDSFVLPVTSESFLSAQWPDANVEFTESKTDYLILHPDARSLLPLPGRQPNADDLLAVLRLVIAAYETKTTRALRNLRGVSKIWAQCAAESLILSRMLSVDCKEERFIPVFGGDLQEHMVIHEAEQDVWHAATSEPSSILTEQTQHARTAVACMRCLVRSSRVKIDSQVSAESPGPPAAGQPLLGHEEGAAPMDSSPAASDSSSDNQSSKQDVNPSIMPAACGSCTSGSFHDSQLLLKGCDLFSREQEEDYAAIWQHLLGSDEHARAAGLPGAPTSIKHSTFREDFQSMRIVYPD